MCADNKRWRIKSAVSDWIKTIKRPKFMTFTVRHSTASLEDQINKLYDAYRRFRQHKFLKKKQRGGVWFFQLKRSKKTNDWHPHLHVVVDMDYINKVEIQDEWLLVTGDSFVVDIRAIKDEKKVADYVSRYASKPCNLSDFTPDDQDCIESTLHKRRLVGKFGTGNTCDFKTCKPVDWAKWSRVCSWTDCVLNRHDNSLLNQVIKAWSTKTPLSAETADSVMMDYAPQTYITLHSEKVEAEKQLFFDEFS